MIIAVHGATGVQGAPVVRHLLSQGHQVRALSRNPRDLPPGAIPTPADFTDPESLTLAYRGADAVVLQLPMTFTQTAFVQADSVLKALAANEVRHVIHNTSGGLPTAESGFPFLDARFRLNRDLPTVVPTVSLLTPAALYHEILTDPWSLAEDEIRHPVPGDVPIPWVAAADVAVAIGELLTEPVPAQVIAGPEDLTGEQAAAVLSEVLAREIRWRTTDLDEYEGILRPFLGAEVAAGVAESYRVVTVDSLEPDRYRRMTLTLRDWFSGRR